jgi:hypothetical protein
MHILTGLVLAGLFGKGTGSGHSPLLGSWGPVRTVHLLPGRVRFETDVLRGDPEGGKRLAERLARIEGVDSAATSPVSGTVLIRYDEKVLQADLLFAAIVRLLGVERELERTPVPALARGIRQAGAAANRAVFEQSGGLIDLWTAVPLVLGAIGLYRLSTQRSAVFPAGVTMVWWAYSSLVRGARPAR